MSVVINTNTAATIASNNLSASNAMLQRSLNRLSSGSKIVNASDDAGGVAVASRLSAAAKRSGVVNSNIANGLSFLQNQDSGLKTMGKMLERMSELQSLYMDDTKSDADKGLYQDEFDKLVTAYGDIQGQTFNGKPLFGASADLNITVDESSNGSDTGVYTLSDNSGQVALPTGWGIGDAADRARFVATVAAVPTAESTLSIIGGDGTEHIISFTASDDTLSEVLSRINGAGAGVSASADVDGKITLEAVESGSGGDFTINATAGSFALKLTTAADADRVVSTASAADNVKGAIADIAEARAKNGADQSVLGYYAELNSATKTNFESAVSKIMDVDVAEESTQLARWNTLVQAGTAMIAQANGSTQSALTLLR
jgi:flagellin-like hook-associated protein FlgL